MQEPYRSCSDPSLPDRGPRISKPTGTPTEIAPHTVSVPGFWKFGNNTPAFTIAAWKEVYVSDLSPISFDIETSGLDQSAVITVAGLATDMGAWLALNTQDRAADSTRLTNALEHESGTNVRLSVFPDEQSLLAGLGDFATEHLDSDAHYLTAYNGERWKAGFDLPFVRSACVRHEASWPFPEVAYADTMTMIERFDTGDMSDLVGVYEILVGDDHYDPFSDSGSAVAAFESGEWLNLLLHNSQISNEPGS